MRVLLLAALLSAPLRADEEAANTAHVAASEYGRCYAKSVPAESYGNRGKTQVFRVTEDEDELVESYDWFSQSIYLVCNASDSTGPTGIALVSLGPWPRGEAANADTLALGFHYKGRTVREYSTLDIAGRAENVSRSVSHYTVIGEVAGFQRTRGNEYVFEIRTTDGRTLRFNAATGNPAE